MSGFLKINTSADGGTLITKKLELVGSNNPILKQSTPEWSFKSPPVNPLQLSNEMIEAVKEFKGLGLSCPQVGLPYRMFVMGFDKEIVAFFNPRVLEFSKETQLFEEGCLSFPGLHIKIRRSVNIHIDYYDWTGKHHESKFSGLTARIFQHETDHVNGIPFTQRAGKMALQVAKKKLHKKESKLITALQTGQ